LLLPENLGFQEVVEQREDKALENQDKIQLRVAQDVMGNQGALQVAQGDRADLAVAVYALMRVRRK
jgi:hypothetical protein